jgi:hypothetical protein
MLIDYRKNQNLSWLCVTADPMNEISVKDVCEIVSLRAYHDRATKVIVPVNDIFPALKRALNEYGVVVEMRT